jgi:prevent-host-death family protein
MNQTVISKSKLKPKLFEHLRRVEAGVEELCITDHGKLVAKVVRVVANEEETLRSLQGLVLRYEDPLEPVDISWDAQA